MHEKNPNVASNQGRTPLITAVDFDPKDTCQMNSGYPYPFQDHLPELARLNAISRDNPYRMGDGLKVFDVKW